MRHIEKTTVAMTKKRIKKNISLINAAMNEGLTTKEEISKAAEIKLWEVSEAFREDGELLAKFKVRRRTLVDMAADNIQVILKDKDHPNHFAASKYVLQTYKSDLDDSMDNKKEEGGDGFSIKVGKKSKGSPVKITFSKDNKNG